MSAAANIAFTGLRALSIKVDVTADNIANVNSDGFKKSRVEFEEAYPYGVKATVSRTHTPGTLLPPEAGQSAMRESANVALEEEIVNLTVVQDIYYANLAVIKTDEETQGMLLHLIA
ncbi:MAG: flagellar basal body protein [Syntrophales bacterium]